MDSAERAEGRAAPVPVATPAPLPAVSGALRIAQERARQKERWLPDGDDRHINGELLVCSDMILFDVLASRGQSGFVVTPGWERERALYVAAKYGDDYRARLAIAGALIAAEIDRMDRAAAREGK